jgi:hypothetical protein
MKPGIEHDRAWDDVKSRWPRENCQSIRFPEIGSSTRMIDRIAAGG